MEISKVEALAKIVAVVVAMATLTVPVFADSQAQQPIQFAPLSWTLSVNGNTTSIGVTYANMSPATMNGTAYAVLYNYAGQTVAVVSSPISGIAAGANSTATFGVAVPFDSYTVDVFAVSSGGWAISAVTNSTIVA